MSAPDEAVEEGRSDAAAAPLASFTTNALLLPAGSELVEGRRAGMSSGEEDEEEVEGREEEDDDEAEEEREKEGEGRRGASALPPLLDDDDDDDDEERGDEVGEAGSTTAAAPLAPGSSSLVAFTVAAAAVDEKGEEEAAPVEKESKTRGKEVSFTSKLPSPPPAVELDRSVAGGETGGEGGGEMAPSPAVAVAAAAEEVDAVASKAAPVDSELLLSSLGTTTAMAGPVQLEGHGRGGTTVEAMGKESSMAPVDAESDDAFPPFVTIPAAAASPAAVEAICTPPCSLSLGNKRPSTEWLGSCHRTKIAAPTHKRKNNSRSSITLDERE